MHISISKLFLFAILLVSFAACRKSNDGVKPQPFRGCRIQYLTNGNYVDTLFYDDSLRIVRFKQYWIEHRYIYSGHQMIAKAFRDGRQFGTTVVIYNSNGTVDSLFYTDGLKVITRRFEYDGIYPIRMLQTQNESYPYKDTVLYKWKDGNLIQEIARYGSDFPVYDTNRLWQQADLFNIMSMYQIGVPSPIRSKNLMVSYNSLHPVYLFDSTGKIGASVYDTDTFRYSWFCQ